MLKTQGQCQFQFGRNTPFILPIETQSPSGNRHIACQIQGLSILISEAIGKLLQSAGDVTEIDRRRIVEEVMVAYVIATEILAYFNAVFALNDTEIVEDLILGYIASLREGADRIEAREVYRARSDNSIGKGAAGFLIVLGELRHVVTQRRIERVGGCCSKDMRLLELVIPGRLLRDGVKLGADRVERRGLCSVIQLIAVEHRILVANALIYATA